MASGTIVLSGGLSRSEQAELRDFLPDGTVQFRRAELSQGELGEPLTAIAIIALSYAAITGICAWLAAKGKNVTLHAKVTVPGISSEIDVTLSSESKPGDVRKDLQKLGGQIRETP